jgi:uncharacterized membrane protein YphA (DoxX/SURF4 family)
MLSLFPVLLSYERVAPFLLRLVLAVILFHWSYGRFKKGPRTPLLTAAGIVEAVTGLLLFLGLLTQLAALILIIVMIAKLAQKIKTKAFFTDGVNYYFVVLVIAVSLLFLGPGAFAFDYPL